MILKYLSFFIGLTWSYSLIKTQSVFSKKAGLIFKLFITKVSWFTFIAAVYFGYKNFSFQFTIIGIIPLLIWYVTDTKDEENIYGPNPKTENA